MKLDVEQTRLSHILKMRQLFSDNRGETPVQVHFESNGQPVGVLHIDEKWGVKGLPEVQKGLEKMDAVLSVSHQKQ